MADIQLKKKTQKGTTGIPELALQTATRICLAIKLLKQNLGLEDLWGKKASEKIYNKHCTAPDDARQDIYILQTPAIVFQETDALPRAMPV